MTRDDSHAELVARLERLLAEAVAGKHDHERLAHDLQVHQIELELQNHELREAQVALETSRSRYLELYDFAPVAYFTFDVGGCIEEVNLSGATLVGVERAQLIGAPLTALVTFAEPARFWAHLRTCAETRASVTTEFAVTTRAGAAHHVRFVSSPVAGVNGRILSFRTAVIDVTDRHLAEQARDLALSSERALRAELEVLDHAKTMITRQLAQASDESMSGVMQTICDLARAQVDAAYAAIGVGGAPDTPFDRWVSTGMTAAQVASIGRAPNVVGLLAVVVERSAPIRIHRATCDPAFRGSLSHHPEMTSFLGVPLRFGDLIVGNLYLTNKRGGEAFTADDERYVVSLGRYVGVAMEVARLSDVAQAAIRSRDHVLASVSHDLRSPLSAISLSAALIDRLLTSEEHAAHRQTATIQRAADRMSRFVDDLLTASTIDAGELTTVLRPEPLGPLIDEVVEMARLEATEASVSIETRVPPSLPEVQCDRDRIYRVLANLLQNATKFTPPDGRIVVEAVQRGPEVEVSVANTGPGIPDDVRAKIFERFWRGDAQLHSRRSAGLGLYICKGIIERHGGRIWVDMALAEGATFRFTLPVAGAGSPRA